MSRRRPSASAAARSSGPSALSPRSAAGKAVASGGRLSGRLTGEIVLKLGAGDVKLPIAASGTIEVLP